MEKKPIKRNENILPLSREHHFSLLFGWKVREGLKKGIAAERIVKYVDYFWRENLSLHFKEEEATLFAATEDDLVKKALSDHAEIKAAVEALLSNKQHQVAQLEKIARLVDAHVRLEEREVFPHLEKKLSEEELGKIGRQLAELHADQLKDNFKDEFWNEK